MTLDIPTMFLMAICLALVIYMVWRDKVRERQAHIERQEAAKRVDTIAARALESVEQVTKTTSHDFLEVHKDILNERAIHEQTLADTRMNTHERAIDIETRADLEGTDDLYIGGRKPNFSKVSATEHHAEEPDEETPE